MTRAALLVLLLPISLFGCIDAPIEEASPEGEETTQGVTTMNALTMNALTMNALTMNALTMNGTPAPSPATDEARKQLTAYKLTAAQLTSPSSSAVWSALGSTELTGGAGSPTRGQLAVELLKYIYSCAMPAGVSTTLTGVNGQPGGSVKLDGQLGLASGWATGSCKDDCRELVSACVLARVNAFGQPVEISMRAPAYGLSAGATEASSFSEHEGAFYGNLFGRGDGSAFTGSWDAYACYPDASSLGSGALVAVTHRACARPGGYCPISVVGPCSASCSGGAGAYGSCAKPGGGATYRPVSIYLKPVDPVCGNGVCETNEANDCPIDCGAALVMPVLSPGFSARVVDSVAHPENRSAAVIVVGIVQATAGVPSALSVGSGITLPQQSLRDMFVVKYEALQDTTPETIRVAWATREPIAVDTGAGGTVNLDPTSIAVDPDGDVAVAGKGFVAMYDKGVGQRLWRIVEPARPAYDSVWINPVGDVVASGLRSDVPTTRTTARYTVVSGFKFAWFDSPGTGIPAKARALHPLDTIQYDFYESKAAGSKLHLQRLSSEGVALSSFDVQLPAISAPVPLNLGVDGATGKIVVAGYDAADGGTDKTPFIAEVSPAGALSWVNVFRSQLGRTLAMERLCLYDGRIYVGGKFSGPTDFHGSLAGPPITPAFDVGSDTFVARYDFQTGSAEWARTDGGNGSDALDSFSVDGAGKLWTFGEFSGAARVDWKKINGSSDGGSDIFLERSYPGHNLSLHMAALQTSTYSSQGVVGAADKAVDGNTNGAFTAGSVASTNGEQGAFWQVDLGAIRWADYVLIYRRTDGQSTSFDGFSVQTSGTGNADTDFIPKYSYAYDPHPPTGKVLRLDSLGNIRYLRIRQEQAKSLGLAEVEVWGH